LNGSGTKIGHGDSGSASRFFYCAKASKADREDGVAGVAGVAGVGALRDGGRESKPRKNHHPTVKPTALMQYLCRLVTPPGGTVLDPFTGSGSTGKAAILEGFNFIGIEREAEYVKIARARILHAESKHSETLVSHAI
jgi:site-specific DNA-methyltransferase (adenine-specific)